jgi:hypothetical protein
LTQKGRQDGNPAAFVLMDGTMHHQLIPTPARRQRSALNPDNSRLDVRRCAIRTSYFSIRAAAFAPRIKHFGRIR